MHLGLHISALGANGVHLSVRDDHSHATMYSSSHHPILSLFPYLILSIHFSPSNPAGWSTPIFGNNSMPGNNIFKKIHCFLLASSFPVFLVPLIKIFLFSTR